jgi:hypothetical protein
MTRDSKLMLSRIGMIAGSMVSGVCAVVVDQHSSIAFVVGGIF